MSNRFLGIDVGAETIKLVELQSRDGKLVWTRRQLVEHNKEPARALRELLAKWDFASVDSAAVSGRLGRTLQLQKVPAKQAQGLGFRHLHGGGAATVVSIGSHGFSVLELREGGAEIFRENSRCSQGTGNFLRQLVERFDLNIEQAAELCAEIADPAPLSGRCPVILKTDMTHLANKGESKARILAGLFDAVCENVQVLLKPRLSPPRVILAGGVSRSRRIQENFKRFADKHGMQLLPVQGDDALFLEALGCAVVAAERPAKVPSLENLFAPEVGVELEEVPGLSRYLAKVKRLPAPPVAGIDGPRDVVLGFDIGSTGSKAVAVDIATRQVVWEGYLRTNGNPVGAAQQLMKQFVESPARICRIRAVGATGSGREIVGSLMATCYGGDQVFVLNEIAAHAEGATFFDPRVDTIFEIGGQDAKYIRLSHGRVIDAAMNEACSAGTGSFIEEQGKKFNGVESVAQLGKVALSADKGISLGQHCSVFMAEIIDEAVGAGRDSNAIIAGIYDSIIQNYLNRVKGSRSVGQVIFCQGMPFAADALAAAVVRQTGSLVIVPPNPGTIGALGIGLLTMKNLGPSDAVLDPARFLSAAVESKDTFICKSTVGCGGAGNKCRIDRISTVVEGARSKFTWGGGCSLYDKGTRKKKLPDLSPDPFREREELLQALVDKLTASRGKPTVALTDEFSLKGSFPFFATFLHELGFDLKVKTGADHHSLKRGIEEANVPFCAPMQQYHGLVSQMAEEQADYLFLPMLRETTRVRDEAHSCLCPIVQAAPDMLKWDLGKQSKSKLISTLVDAGPGNYESEPFVHSCERIARDLGVEGDTWRVAYHSAVEAQKKFDLTVLELGQRALDFCQEQGVTPVVVLGRNYTIYNTVLNSNVPAILREQGAIAIPVDCYPVRDDVPVFEGMYWTHSQKNLRAAHQIRRTPGIYALYASNYSCGPDSFTLHFFAYIMEGRPFAVIETDGHSGDAGTKTRVEAFLHCVREDLAASKEKEKKATNFDAINKENRSLDDAKAKGSTLLIPRMGPGAETLAAAFRGVGIRAESLPMPTRDTLRLGRRHTSGKECVPMTITTGSLLERMETEADKSRDFTFLMPTAYGPCRFGVYHLLHKIILERLELKDRVKLMSPDFSSYFDAVPDGFVALIFAGFMADDLLLEARLDALPVEVSPGAADAVYRKWHGQLLELIEEAGHHELSNAAVLVQVANGNLFGVTELLERAAAEFASIKRPAEVPAVMMVGEIYVRCDPFANDFVAEKLSEKGIRVRFAPFNEWLEYADYINYKNGERRGLGAHLSSFVRSVIQSLCWTAMAAPMGWPRRTTVRDSLAAAEPYIREDFQGESVLTVGGPVHEWREGHIDGVISVGPLECMPNKISESQFFHVAEKEGLLSLTLSLNGDPVAQEAIDNFAFEVHSRFRNRQQEHASAAPEAAAPRMSVAEMSMMAARQAMKLANMAFPGAPTPMKVLRKMGFGSPEPVAPVMAQRAQQKAREEV